MIWLLGVVFILQSFFYWILKPGINFLTPIVELRGLGLLALFIGAWLISGKGEEQGGS